MENFNTVPSQGKFGDSVAVVNENFLLAQQEMEILRNLISPDTKYVTAVATAQTTSVTQVLPATGSTDTVYRVGKWDGTQYDATVYSEYAWFGSQYKLLATKEYGIDTTPTAGSENLITSGAVAASIVYDISAAHSGAAYADLAAALGTNGSNVPDTVRKGGMSVKFVCTYDNKYMQYRLMKDEWSTTVTDWQGVDATPTAGSENIMNSYGTNTAIQKERGVVYEIGGINVDNGQELVNAAQLRSSFIFPDKDGNISIHCDFPLALRALLLYNEKGVYESKIFAGTSYSDYSYNSNGKPVRGIFIRTYGTNIQANDYKSITVNGYRIRLYSGTNSRESRQKAYSIGYLFKSSYLNVPVYTHFVSPHWTCCVGNFKTYEDAQKFLSELKATNQFNGAMIIKSKIQVSQ